MSENNEGAEKFINSLLGKLFPINNEEKIEYIVSNQDSSNTITSINSHNNYSDSQNYNIQQDAPMLNSGVYMKDSEKKEILSKLDEIMKFKGLLENLEKGQARIQENTGNILENTNNILEQAYNSSSQLRQELEKGVYDIILSITNVGEAVIKSGEKNYELLNSKLNKYFEENSEKYSQAISSIFELIEDNKNLKEMTYGIMKKIDQAFLVQNNSLENILKKTEKLEEIGGYIFSQFIISNAGFQGVRKDKGFIYSEKSSYSAIISIKSPAKYNIIKVSTNQQPFGANIHNKGFVSFEKSDNEWFFTPENSLIPSLKSINAEQEIGQNDVFTITYASPESKKSHELVVRVDLEVELKNQLFQTSLFVGPNKIIRDDFGKKLGSAGTKLIYLMLNYKGTIKDFISQQLNIEEKK
jgi:hypothetical protein